MKYQPKKKSSTLNLAPMIDIVFLLLIFFLVSSTLQGEEALYNISVPESSIGQSSEQKNISVFLDQKNQIYYQEKEYSRQQLDKLFAELNAGPVEKVKIYADQESNFDSLVFLIEKFKNNGYQNISFALREEK
ncbi:outer membrane transport energization protein ExbD [Halanaerobium saccharolyticum]|jgi:biopolymer transport protein ExbD|uniref:Outer membrane transport energization protein ExbD n=1 Tax=Halanaerobium saccharolyticum TaxID=43595 RepID=A0A2T5RIF6_9FIRM|nr:biopolymer transporter ExbD [Halanaerobium saccharolyticum]PTV98028.1 outer membrane transport energization protein ExbD [Halanaerobium saccharolyticum]TDP97042.1 outer membrane transport energization protein ExbD [Halanaerobium saccharolyticum]